MKSKSKKKIKSRRKISKKKSRRKSKMIRIKKYGGDKSLKRKRYEEVIIGDMTLNKNLLEIIKSFLKLDFEICGTLKTNPSGKMILEIHSQNKIVDEGDKSMCYHLSYFKNIFHTHTNNSKAYPSAKDIIKVMKNSDILSSLIFCKWGIWEIYSAKKYNFSNTEKKN